MSESNNPAKMVLLVKNKECADAVLSRNPGKHVGFFLDQQGNIQAGFESTPDVLRDTALFEANGSLSVESNGFNDLVQEGHYERLSALEDFKTGINALAN